jgi:hypothetical protein
MPFLFFFPLIVWAGLFGVAEEAMRAPVKAKGRK